MAQAAHRQPGDTFQAAGAVNACGSVLEGAFPHRSHQTRAPSRLMALAKALETLLDDDEATADEIAMFVALARYTDANGVCRPSQTTIALRLGRSRPWVNARISRMVEMDMIERERRRQPKGGETSCQYYLPQLDMTLQTAVSPLTPPVTGMTPPVSPLTQNLSSHQPKNLSLSSGEGGFAKFADDGEACPTASRSHLCINLIAPTWVPSSDDLAWASTMRPDVGLDALQAFTAKFIAKINAAGGTHRSPSVKWREWLSAEIIAQPVPMTASSRPQTSPAPSTPDATPAPQQDAAADKNLSTTSAGLATTPTDHPTVMTAIPVAPPPTLPETVAAAAKVARHGATLPMFDVSDEDAAAMSAAIQPAVASLDTLLTPTAPGLVHDFMTKFAARRNVAMPKSDLLALEVSAISQSIPADLFAAACREIWATFAYRRLPESPDFIRAVQHQIAERKAAVAQIKAMDQKLRSRAALAAKPRMPRQEKAM